MEEKKVQVPAHKALGTLLQELLTPVGIKVVTEFQVMAESPKGDILILRRQPPAWTPAQRALQAFPPAVQTVMSFLWRQWTMVKEGEMELEITPEQLIELSKQWQKMMLASLSPEEVLPYFKPKERLAGLPPEEIVTYLKPEERLAGLLPEEIVTYLKPEERLAGLPPEEVLPHFKPEERLAGLPVEEIEAYLRKLKRGGQNE